MTLYFNLVNPEWVISKAFNNQSKQYSTNNTISPDYVASQNDAPKKKRLVPEKDFRLYIFHKSYGLSEENNESQCLI